MPRDKKEPGLPLQQDRGEDQFPKEHRRGRSRARCPHSWQEKAALRRIREAFDESNTVLTGIAVYVALSEIASDEQSDLFQTTHAYIALKAGVSKSTAEDRVNDLSEIRLVEVLKADKGLKIPSTYLLLNVEQPLPNDRQPLPNVEQRTKNQPLLSLEESKKNLPEESVEGTAQKGFTPPSLEKVKAIATDPEIGLSIADAEKFFYHYESKGWRVGRTPMKSLRAALQSWKRNDFTQNRTQTKPSHANTPDYSKPF